MEVKINTENLLNLYHSPLGEYVSLHLAWHSTLKIISQSETAEDAARKADAVLEVVLVLEQ